MKGYLTLIASLCLGIYVGSWVSEAFSSHTIILAVKFFTGFYAAVLAVAWNLKANLSKLSEVSVGDQRKAREVDHRVTKGMRRVAIQAFTILICMLFALTSSFWSELPKEWFEKSVVIAIASIFVTLAFVLNMLVNLYEVYKFNMQIQRMKQDNEAKKALLSEFQKKE